MTELLSFSPAAIGNKESFQSEFQRIATSLMSDYVLSVGGQQFRLCELEFYFHGGDHLDVFAHQDPQQLTSGQWYFHRQNGKNFKSGSYKGLDISCGLDGHGGILIRALRRLDSEMEYIDGPSLCVDTILRAAGKDSISNLVSDSGFSWEVCGGGILQLEEISVKDAMKQNGSSATAIRELDHSPICASSRVGLTLKQKSNIDKRVYYIVKPYRFVCYPKLVKKGKLNLIASLYAQGKGEDEIQRITGSTQRIVSKYIANYQSGDGLQPNKFYGIALKTVELAQLHNVCG